MSAIPPQLSAGGGGRATERSPLLPGPPPVGLCDCICKPFRCCFPCCDKVSEGLSLVTARHIFVLSIYLFVFHLAARDLMNAFGWKLREVFVADILQPIYIMMAVANIVTTPKPQFREWSCQTFQQALFKFCWVILNVTLIWHSALRCCAVHHLESRCFRDNICTSVEELFLDGGWAFFPTALLSSWTRYPFGLLQCVGNVMWRPWNFLFYLLPLTVMGQGPIHDNAIPWQDWRQIIVGLAFWFLFLVGIVVIRHPPASMARTNQFGHTGMVVWSTSFSLWVLILLTSQPPLELGAFLITPWSTLLESSRTFKAPELLPEQWGAVAMWILAAMRGCYAYRMLFDDVVERWHAKWKIDEALRYAIDHPFRAELEDGFSLPAGLWGTDSDRERERVATQDLEGGEQPRSFVRTITRLISGERLKTLREKQKGLVAARKTTMKDEEEEAKKARQAAGRPFRAPPDALALSVRRDHLLEDTWKVLFEKSVPELLWPETWHFKVEFQGEPGQDLGGVRRDWFDSVARELLRGIGDGSNPNSLLVEGHDSTLIPRPSTDQGTVSRTDEEKYRALMALGRFIALAVYREQPLPLAFSLVACKHFLSAPIGKDDVQRLDPQFYRLRIEQVMKDGGIEEINQLLGEPLTFLSAPTDLMPAQPLKEGGASLLVTEANREEYVQLLCEAHLCGGMRREYKCLLEGFWQLLPADLLHQVHITPRDLSVLISGLANLDPDEWFRHSENEPLTGAEIHGWFWQCVRDMDSESRCMLLQFVTGSSRLPPGGFADLRARGHPFKVTVMSHGGQRGVGDNSKLPEAHTCFNQIVLRDYASYEQLQEKLTLAITAADGFGIA